VPFRQAHDITGRAVKAAEAKGVMLDGLTDAESVGNEWFGQERLLATAESLRTGSMTALVDGLVDAVDRFATGREQADDVTLLAFGTRD
jgi:serine phosphatase RsbU (regulator of sigma subunit)